MSVAYPPAPVGADAVGGAEQILTLIDEALAAAGARSIVIAAEGSTCAGELRAIPRPRGTLDEAARREAQAHARAAIARTLDERAVDVVHLHGLDFAAYLPPPGPRVVVTLHLPPAWYSPRAFAAALERRDVSFVCVSAAQRAACPAGLEPIVIANGVAVERFAGRRRRLGFALGLGRVCPEKGWHLAIDACARAGVPLVLGGRVFEYTEHERYFREQVAPRLGAGVRFAGALGAARKRRLLGAARALIAPSLAPETSSLAAMEALASGTPVVALRAGALGEIVEHGRTGFLADSVDELADGLRRAGEIDAALCRSTALARFDAAAMTARYLDLYRRLPRPAPRAEQPHDEQRRPEQLHVEQLRVARLHGEQTLDEQSYGEQTCGERILDERTLDEQTRGERTLDERTLGEPTRREPTRREPTRREPTL
ncbi:MAG TPA: glycosyltransferase, partial [Polyangia bacterium]|nr:glycosyltransferase [Polyangia bacterium]